MTSKNRYSGQDFSQGEMACPDCGNKIPLDFRKLFFGASATCTGCGIVLSVNREESRESINAMKEDNISQFAHILGGIFGSIFGFWKGKFK